MVRRVLFVISFFLLARSAGAQPGTIRFQHITTDDGLSQDIITSIAQDDLGFMWFGTEDGLNVYDGYSCTVLKHLPGDSTTISGNSIGPMLADGRGRLWVSASGGTDLFDARTRRIRHLMMPGTGERLYATALCLTPDSSVWMSTGEGLLRARGDLIERARIAPPAPSDTPWSIVCEPPDILWTISPTSIHRFRVRGDTLLPLRVPDSFRALEGHLLSTLYRDSRNTYWVLTGDQGIYRFDATFRPSGHFHMHATGNARILEDRMRTVIEGPSHTMWFGTMTGLEVFEPGSARFIHFRGSSPAATGFLGSRTYSLFLDRSGILWVGTYRGGINTYAPIRQKFRVMSLSDNSSTLDAFAVGEDEDGTLLVGTDRGMYSVSSPGGTDKWSLLQGTSGQQVYSVCRRKNGQLWAGMEGKIELIRGPATGPRRYLFQHKGPVPVVFEDRGENLWIGTTLGGLFDLPRGASHTKPWAPNGEPFTGAVWTLFQDRRDHLWIGTGDYQSVFELDEQTGRAYRHGGSAGDTGFVPGIPIKAIREDSIGGLWLGMWGNGIAHVNPRIGLFENYSESDGLASSFVKSIELDRHGSLWIGTERGLTQFDPQRKTFRTFTKRDGLPSDFFYSGSSARLHDGSLCFGSGGGCVLFDPDSLHWNTSVPPVVITTFRLFDRPVPLETDGSGVQRVTLRYDQNFFSFEFVTLDFTDPQRNRYGYMLEGFDTAWVEAGARRYAAYTHLDPGSYTFRVKGSNSDGIWNTEGASVAVLITPAFWMTWWFRLALLAVVVASAWALYRYRIHAILQVEHLRQRIARDLHDDIGTNLSAIVLASEMPPSVPSTPEVRSTLEEIRSVALVTQEHMRDIVWMLNPRNDSPQMLIARMREDATRLLRTIPHTFRGPTGELPKELSLGLKRNIFLVYKESLHNILRHSRASTAAIDVEYLNGTLDICVQDDGVGFDPRTVTRGNGLDSMLSRTGQIGAELQIDSVQGSGTRIRLRAKIT